MKMESRKKRRRPRLFCLIRPENYCGGSRKEIRIDCGAISYLRQVPVFDPMRLVRRSAEARMAIGFVIGIIPFKPNHAALAFEGEDVRRHAIQKPAVVADHHGASRKILQRFFEGAQRIHVQIVGGLVEQQNVGALLQHLRQMHSISLAARQIADLLLLIASGKIESRDICTRRTSREPS